MPAKKQAKKTTTKQSQENAKEETYKVEGSGLIEKVKELIKEGNVRSIIIKDKKGKEIVQIPLTIGVIGVAVAPILAAVGAIAALVTECTVTVIRRK